MKTIFRRWLDKSKCRIQRRLDKTKNTTTFRPRFRVNRIEYEISQCAGAIGCGGIGAIHGLVQQLGLADAIDRRLRLLKVHMPYRESEHVFNIAYIPLCNGICLQDIELRRNDENFLNALGVDRIPDPTTAGDFCRRFTRSDLYVLMDVINETRLKSGPSSRTTSSTAPPSTWTAPTPRPPASAKKGWTSLLTASGATTPWR